MWRNKVMIFPPHLVTLEVLIQGKYTRSRLSGERQPSNFSGIDGALIVYAVNLFAPNRCDRKKHS